MVSLWQLLFRFSDFLFETLEFLSDFYDCDLEEVDIASWGILTEFNDLDRLEINDSDLPFPFIIIS